MVVGDGECRMERVTFEGRDDLNEGGKGRNADGGMGIGRHNIVGGWKKLHGRMLPGPRGARAAGAKIRSGRWGQGPLTAPPPTHPQPGGPDRAQTTNEAVPPAQQAAHRIALQLDSADCF